MLLIKDEPKRGMKLYGEGLDLSGGNDQGRPGSLLVAKTTVDDYRTLSRIISVVVNSVII